MSQYKVGQQVKITTSFNPYLTVGKLYEVTRVDEDDRHYPIMIRDDDGDEIWIAESEFEAVPERVIVNGRYVGQKVRITDAGALSYGFHLGDVCSVGFVERPDYDGSITAQIKRADGELFWLYDGWYQTLPDDFTEVQAVPEPTPITTTSSAKVVYEVKRDGQNFSTKWATRAAAFEQVADCDAGTIRVFEATERTEVTRREVATVVVA